MAALQLNLLLHLQIHNQMLVMAMVAEAALSLPLLLVIQDGAAAVVVHGQTLMVETAQEAVAVAVLVVI